MRQEQHRALARYAATYMHKAAPGDAGPSKQPNVFLVASPLCTKNDSASIHSGNPPAMGDTTVSLKEVAAQPSVVETMNTKKAVASWSRHNSLAHSISGSDDETNWQSVNAGSSTYEGHESTHAPLSTEVDDTLPSQEKKQSDEVDPPVHNLRSKRAFKHQSSTFD
ncbi:hypothetical protein CFOL_v3_24692 [Cephalotus follicularis]|uniref:Uncharacterized protein n=1 Tax=Cephalotus follicularis TaxID=3775 RepID=A0A1Q3CLV8_CEPFO|nr:hypothetical protein CFOL_v3_24692 [Cephalotus follicularis]